MKKFKMEFNKYRYDNPIYKGLNYYNGYVDINYEPNTSPFGSYISISSYASMSFEQQWFEI